MRKRYKKGRKPTCCKCGKIRENESDGYCRLCRNGNVRKNRKRHCELSPEQKLKANARSYLNVYIRRGKISKQRCHCGSYDVEAHHEDYTKPLEVVWLCRLHHLRYHGVTLPDNYKPPTTPFIYNKNEKEWEG